MNSSFLILSSLALGILLSLSGCQTINKTTAKVGGWWGGKTAVPEVNAQGVVDISKSTLNQLEQLSEHMPKNQWVYMKNKKEQVYSLQNKSAQDILLSFRLNCQHPGQKPTFYLYDAEGNTLLQAYDPKAGQIQFLLDNKNYGNPFDLYNRQKLERFKAALKTAQIIKIYHAATLYTFQNGHAELLEQPVSCRD